MTMTIDEAIKHCYEVADGAVTNCKACEDEHRQLARWLEELKTLREQLSQVAVKESNPKCEETTRDMSEVWDNFFCEKCGFMSEMNELKYDDDEENTTMQYEYSFKFCPECGRKVLK